MAENEIKTKRPYTEKQKISNRRWDAANLDRMSIAFRKGLKDKIQSHAYSRGESVNAFIQRAVLAQIDRDNSEGESDD